MKNAPKQRKRRQRERILFIFSTLVFFLMLLLGLLSRTPLTNPLSLIFILSGIGGIIISVLGVISITTELRMLE
jgi:hypothetical protein